GPIAAMGIGRMTVIAAIYTHESYIRMRLRPCTMTGTTRMSASPTNAHVHSGHAWHGHDHAPPTFGTAFALGSLLNIGFVVAEFVFGLISNSTALLADAGHNLSDVGALLIAWGAAVLARRAPSPRYTYGLGSTSIIAALFNAIILLVAVGAI